MSRILGLTPEAFAKMTAELTLEETGAFARLAALCLASQKTGGVVITLAKIGVEPAKAWEVVTSLALRGSIVARVSWGESVVAIDEEMRWGGIEPRLNTVVRVELPECAEDWSREEKRRAALRERVRRCRDAAAENGAENGASTIVTQKTTLVTPKNTACNAEKGVTVTPCNAEGVKPSRNASGREGAHGHTYAGERKEDGICDTIYNPPITPLEGGVSSPSFGAKEAFDEKTAAAEGEIPEKTGAAAADSPAPCQKTPAQKKPKPKKGARVQANTPTMLRIGSWFGRMPRTLWSIDEAERLAAVAPTDDELDLLEDYYRSTDPEIAPYRRRAIVTLLNNWTKDCDVARQKLGRVGGIPLASSSSCAGLASVGDFTIY